MTSIKTLENILLKVNSKSNDLYFDLLNFTFEQIERLVKMVKKIFKVRLRLEDFFKCTGIVELSKRIDSLYYVKFGKRL